MVGSKQVNSGKLIAMFKALSNPNRLKILELVAKNRYGNLRSEFAGMHVGQIASDLQLVQSTVSHHLRQLRHANLIEMKRCGQNIECSINSNNLKYIKNFFQEMRQTN